MVYGPLDGEMVQYEYDCRNRLVKAGDTTYEYDAENNRIAVLTEEYREEYVVNTNAELSQVLTATRYEKNAAGYSRGGEKTTYTYGNGLVSQYTEENGTEYYHYNNIGSTMYLTKNGVKTHEFAYSTYGELTLGEYGEVRFLYNGQFGVATDDNGLYHMRARYYNPEIRRFINQDILTGSIENSQSLNRYAYCQGNPVNYFDPFGLEPCEFFSGLGHGVLNLLGLIPGIGDVFDITNAIWYFAEGKVGRGIEAGIAALPFIGNLLPETRLFNYTRRALNIISYGGTACLAGQGMISGGQALWAEINSGHCSGWSIALGIANIGLNGVTLFFSGKNFVSETKTLNKMLKADGVYDRIYDEVVKFHHNNSGFLNPDAFKIGSNTGKLTIIKGGEYSISEINAAHYMADLGNTVILRPPTGTRAGGKTSDLVVNGINYDVYTPKTSNPSAIVRAVTKKNDQTIGVVLDLSKTTVTANDLGNISARVRGAIEKKGGICNINDIVVMPK